jgi:hypothetical protein
MAAGGAAGRLTSPAIIEAALPASGILLDEHVKDISFTTNADVSNSSGLISA